MNPTHKHGAFQDTTLKLERTVQNFQMFEKTLSYERQKETTTAKQKRKKEFRRKPRKFMEKKPLNLYMFFNILREKGNNFIGKTKTRFSTKKRGHLQD